MTFEAARVAEELAQKLRKKAQSKQDSWQKAYKTFEESLESLKQADLAMADADDRCDQADPFWHARPEVFRSIQCFRQIGHEGKHRTWLGSDQRLYTWS